MREVQAIIGILCIGAGAIMLLYALSRQGPSKFVGQVMLVPIGAVAIVVGGLSLGFGLVGQDQIEDVAP